MTIFDGYSRYYDLLYRDRDYGAETRFILQKIQRFAPHARTILDLGCGTGQHAMLLAQSGYQVTGIDRSEQMLEAAHATRAKLDYHTRNRLELLSGDIKALHLNKSFDVIVALFHVISYQTSNANVQDCLSSIRSSLNPRGLVLFDCWYGPAVLNQKPSARMKRCDDETVYVTRLANPTVHANENLVDVSYTLLAVDKTTPRFEEVRETHRMRYFFKPELEIFLSSEGLRIVDFTEWLTDHVPSEASWSVLLAATPVNNSGSVQCCE